MSEKRRKEIIKKLGELIRNSPEPENIKEEIEVIKPGQPVRTCTGWYVYKGKKKKSK